MKIQSLCALSIIFLLSSGLAEAAATGICKDGTEATGTNKRSACRGHKGIQEWYGEAAQDTEKPAKKTKKSKSDDTEEAPAASSSGPATGICKDGSETSGTNKRSACRGHKGVKEWFADKGNSDKSEDKPSRATKDEPGESAVAGGAVTGICKDGFETSGTNKRSACRGHKGVKEWFADKDKSEKSEDKPSRATKDEPGESAAAGGAVTGICKDGFETSGTNKRSACRGHKGVKEWYGDTTPAAADKAAAKKAAADDEAVPEEKEEPVPPKARKRSPPPAAGSGKVWVNTRSKIYHCEDSRFYGNTKEGEYMSEEDAQAQGFVANRKKVCQ